MKHKFEQGEMPGLEYKQKNNQRRTMNAYHEAIQYVISQATQAQDDKEYPSAYDIYDIIHEELDYYCSTLYTGECDEIIVSYGLTKALVEYDNQFGDYPKTSQGLLYVIMMDVVREKIDKRIEMEKAIDKAFQIYYKV